MAAAICQAKLKITVKKSKLGSVSSDFSESYIATENFCAYTNISYYSLESYKFHILPIGSTFYQILQLGSFHFIYLIINFRCSLYKYKFDSNVIAATSTIFNQLNCAVHHNLQRKGFKKKLSFARTRLLPKNSTFLFLL